MKSTAWLVRFGLVLVLTPFMLWRKEWYPFSHFPMYSAFSSRTFSVFITDSRDRPLPSYPNFDCPTSMLKKIVVNKLRRYKVESGERRMIDLPRSAWEDAGREALEWLRENRPPRDPALEGEPLRLYAEELFFNDGRVCRETWMLAELPR
jgi:hypothetical protein